MADFELSELTTTALGRAILVALHAEERCAEHNDPIGPWTGAERIFAALRVMLEAEELWRQYRGSARPAFRVETLADLPPEEAAAGRNRAAYLAGGLRDSNVGTAAARLWNAVCIALREVDSDRLASDVALSQMGA